MIQSVTLSICGRQTYLDQEPEVIELVTEGTLESIQDGWLLSYDESALTGLEGVHTSFRIEKDMIVLTRTGKLNSQMIFREGITHDSLYQMDFGALMITVCATHIAVSLDETGGTVDLVYTIEIEQTAAGTIDYHLEIKPSK